MINFIKKRRLWYAFSIVVIGIGIISMAMNYKVMNHVFNLGIDFTGGTSITIRFNKPTQDLEQQLRSVLVGIDLKTYHPNIWNK